MGHNQNKVLLMKTVHSTYCSYKSSCFVFVCEITSTRFQSLQGRVISNNNAIVQQAIYCKSSLNLTDTLEVHL